MALDKLSNRAIACAIEVHWKLGSGSLGLICKQCFCPLRALRVLRGETILCLYGSLGA